MEERVCNSDESVEFTCETSKPCRVEWFLNDKHLSSSSQFNIQSIDNRHILCIPKVKLADKGWYKCSVQDTFTEAKLTVIGNDFLISFSKIRSNMRVEMYRCENLPRLSY